MPKTTKSGGGSNVAASGPSTPAEDAPLLRGRRIAIDDGAIRFSDDGGNPDVVLKQNSAGELGYAGPVEFSDTVDFSGAVNVSGTLTAFGYLGAGGNFGIGSGASQGAFFGATPISKPTVSGSTGANAALASLLTALANLGLITDSTT